MASWRIPVILLALVAFLLGATGPTRDGHPDQHPAYQAASVLSDEASDTHDAIRAVDECAGLACCLAVHCASCAVPASADFPSRRMGQPARLAHRDFAFPRAGRVIAPPTAPPKFA